jgi:hypothetical protein
VRRSSTAEKGGAQKAPVAYFWRQPAPLHGPQALGQQYDHLFRRHLDSKGRVLQVTSQPDAVSEHALS